ncbi:MAG: type II toxin-antitoxin system RelE/ParE family toxin [Defluviitaleaceae bacterium]|nr:type II toxin-antitoxin system RelE/ParE family toxin [Defluviitaleaceae bacterium]
MGYIVNYSDNALKDLKKMGRNEALIIVAWIEKNLVGCENPRLHGKRLGYEKRGEWRYRVGSYRIIADIQDNFVTIEIINVGHRRDIYG